MGKVLDIMSFGLTGAAFGGHKGNSSPHTFLATPGPSAGPNANSPSGQNLFSTAPLALPNTGSPGNSGKTLLGQ